MELPIAIKKFFLLVLILFCIGLPIIDNLHFFVLLLAITIIIFSALTISTKRIIWFIILTLIVIFVKNIMPKPVIQEGHNVFILKGQQETLEKELPSKVFLYIKDLFVKRYPSNLHCDPKAPACWRFYPVPDSLYAFSADSAFARPKYSRIVNSIDFKNLTEFRGGFANDKRYNWYGGSDIKRESMPYFVMYEFSSNSVNSLICWKGHSLWETKLGDFQPQYHKNEQCRALKNDDIGKRIFFASLNNQPQLGFWASIKNRLRRTSSLSEESSDELTVRFIPQAWLRFCMFLSNLLMILSVFVILFLSCRLDLRKLCLAGFFIICAIVIVFVYCPHFYGNYFIHEGGEDGLTHHGLGSIILQDVVKGDWTNAIRGGQDLYFDTPGLRYFRAIEKMLFGDNNYGYLMIILFLPYIFYLFLGTFFGKKLSFVLACIFLIGLSPGKILENLGFSYYMYVLVARGGWPDTIGYFAFFAAVWICFKYYKNPALYIWYGFIGHFLLFISVFMRPNLILAALIVIFYFAYVLFKQKRFKEILLVNIGFLPVFLPLLHNMIFGKSFYLFTSTLQLSISRGVSLGQYLNAFNEALKFNWQGPNLTKAITHLSGLVGPFYRFPLILGLFYVFFRRRGKNYSPQIKLIALIAISLHAANIFLFCTYFRYVFMTWVFTAIVFIDIVYQELTGKTFDKVA